MIYRKQTLPSYLDNNINRCYCLPWTNKKKLLLSFRRINLIVPVYSPVPSLWCTRKSRADKPNWVSLLKYTLQRQKILGKHSENVVALFRPHFLPTFDLSGWWKKTLSNIDVLYITWRIISNADQYLIKDLGLKIKSYSNRWHQRYKKSRSELIKTSCDFKNVNVFQKRCFYFEFNSYHKLWRDFIPIIFNYLE